jgi:hypothetical protein
LSEKANLAWGLLHWKGDSSGNLFFSREKTVIICENTVRACLLLHSFECRK